MKQAPEKGFMSLTDEIAKKRTSAEMASNIEEAKAVETAGKLKMDRDDVCLECGSDMKIGKGGPLCSQPMHICPHCRVALPAGMPEA